MYKTYIVSANVFIHVLKKLLMRGEKMGTIVHHVIQNNDFCLKQYFSHRFDQMYSSE